MAISAARWKTTSWTSMRRCINAASRTSPRTAFSLARVGAGRSSIQPWLSKEL